MGLKGIPQQVTRLALMFLLVGVALVAARHYFIPPTFGQTGHYRGAAVGQIVGQGIKYAGRDACTECHPDIVEVHSRARHQTVACEACHGPAAAHIENPAEVKLLLPRDRSFCPRCHSYDPARPTGFPQIDPIAHNPVKACIGCHNPHTPVPPNTPASCAACHGEIARTKAASPHAVLPCTECHQTSAQHMDTPRASTPTKPATREFCGNCHATDAKSPREIPRVDLASHGGRFLCWQCHYPHDPEVR
jgi:hypothetical protein